MGWEGEEEENKKVKHRLHGAMTCYIAPIHDHEHTTHTHTPTHITQTYTHTYNIQTHVTHTRHTMHTHTYTHIYTHTHTHTHIHTHTHTHTHTHKHTRYHLPAVLHLSSPQTLQDAQLSCTDWVWLEDEGLESLTTGAVIHDTVVAACPRMEVEGWGPQWALSAGLREEEVMWLRCDLGMAALPNETPI